MPRAFGLGITITAIIVTILRSYVSAQAPASCLPGYTSLYNSLNQSPCTMAIALGGVCSNGTDFVEPLSQPSADFAYAGPDQNHTSSCECSTVFYSVLGACGYCQGSAVGIIPWSNYSFYCTPGITYLSSFLDPIPSNTKIPHWAYLDVVTNNTFDPGQAEIAVGPESSALLPTASSTQATASSTQATASSTQATATFTVTFTQMPTQVTTSSAPISSTSGKIKSKTNVGAIAGGVIGGVFLGIVAGLVTCIILRRRKPSGPSPFTSNSAASPATVMSYKNAGSDGTDGSYPGLPGLS